MDLKYITGAQVVEFTYEGRRRRFGVQTIAAKNVDNGLVGALDALTLAPVPPQLWTVGWDCTVVIAAENKSTSPQKVRSHFPSMIILITQCRTTLRCSRTSR